MASGKVGFEGFAEEVTLPFDLAATPPFGDVLKKMYRAAGEAMAQILSSAVGPYHPYFTAFAIASCSACAGEPKKAGSLSLPPSAP
jgi:hypothetical protein